MSTPITCPQCDHAFAATRDGGNGVRCPHCAAWIPLAAAAGTGAPSPGNAGVAAEQWFVAFPDGRRVGPVTGEQFRAAAQQGAIPAGALVRRGDWSEPVSLSDLLSRQDPLAAPTRGTNESYARQFVRNPLGTYFFGPQLAAYEGNRNQGVRATRQQHFRRWLYLLLAMFLSATLLPALAGLLRGDPRLAGGGLILGLMAFFWPAIFFLPGLLMYAGALFEWRWFFQSRTLRHARAMFGESGARKFYLVLGGFLMGGGALFSLGGSGLIAGSILFSAAKRPPLAAGQPPAGQGASIAEQLAPFEKRVRASRDRLDKAAQTLRGLVRQAERLEAEIGAQPNDLPLREQLLHAQEEIASHWSEYRQARTEWEQRVANLEAVARPTTGQSEVLVANQRLPAEHDFSEAIVVQPIDKFPLQNVRITVSQCHRVEANVRQSTLSAAQMASYLTQTARQLDLLRNYLEEVEQKWGYHDPELNKPPSQEWLAQIAAQQKSEKTAALSTTNFLPPAGIAQPSPTRPPDTGAPGTATPASDAPAAKENKVSPLAELDPERDVIRGTVRLERTAGNLSVITDGLTEHVLVRLPIDLPAKYVLEGDVMRLAGDGGLFFVAPLAGSPVALVIDGGDELGPRTGLVAVDRQVLSSRQYPPNVLEKAQFPQGQRVHIRCVVEGRRLEFYVQGQLVYRWNDDPRRLSLPPFYRSGHPASLHLGSFHARFRVQSLEIQLD